MYGCLPCGGLEVKVKGTLNIKINLQVQKSKDSHYPAANKNFYEKIETEVPSDKKIHKKV